ncbi:MAG TPA: hypothetical protein VMR33_22035 [Candidatus Baltobacteraceae bacterium]|jgi:CheY-like chemotaxis protein|nr:hypothetical protein [Candidatus Baltobacteraceae bacterium]
MSQELQNRVALVIDRKIQLRRLLNFVLEPNGYRVFGAANGGMGADGAGAQGGRIQ